MTEEQKKEAGIKFEQKIVELQKELWMEIYPTNAVMENGEVIPVIKFRFTREIEHEVTAEDVKENNLEGEVAEWDIVTIPVK